MIGGADIAGVVRGREGAATEWRQTGVGPTTACIQSRDREGHNRYIASPPVLPTPT